MAGLSSKAPFALPEYPDLAFRFTTLYDACESMACYPDIADDGEIVGIAWISKSKSGLENMSKEAAEFCLKEVVLVYSRD